MAGTHQRNAPKMPDLSEFDPENPYRAVSGAGFEAALPGVSPKGLLEALECPDVIRDIARGDLYIQLAVLRKLAKSPSFTISNRLQYADKLMKLADVVKPDAGPPTAAQLPQIRIVVPQYPPDYRPPLPPRRQMLSVIEQSDVGG